MLARRDGRLEDSNDRRVVYARPARRPGWIYRGGGRLNLVGDAAAKVIGAHGLHAVGVGADRKAVIDGGRSKRPGRGPHRDTGHNKRVIHRWRDTACRLQPRPTGLVLDIKRRDGSAAAERGYAERIKA